MERETERIVLKHIEIWDTIIESSWFLLSKSLANNCPKDGLFLIINVFKYNPSLGQILANELENQNQDDPMIVSQISMSLLLTITENQIAKYIIERISNRHEHNYEKSKWWL